MYIPSEFHISNSNHHNTVLNESETDFDLSRMPHKINEDKLSMKDEDEQSNISYEDKDENI